MSKPTRLISDLIHSNSCQRQSRKLVMLMLLTLCWLPKLYAQQCFYDPEQAYQYLIQQQRQQQLSQQNQMVNLNQAGEAELTQLQGIGSSKAQQIILYRQAFGPFKSVDDLTQVKGIGKKTVANNRERMTVN